MDDEIMNFLWFDNVTWDSIKDLRGTKYVQPTPRFNFALQQAQHAILRAIITITLLHWLPSQPEKLSCSVAGSSWDDPLSTRPRATVLTTWMPGWASSGPKTGQRSGLWYVLNVTLHLCKSYPSTSQRTETVKDSQGSHTSSSR